MSSNEAQRQKKLMKKRRKDKQRKRWQAESIPYTLLSAKKKIHLARQCPVHECLINPSWKDKGLAVVVVSRRQPDGNLLFGVYLVDMLCLGVKNAFCNADFSMSRYNTDVKGGMYQDEDAVPCPSNQAHQIVYGAIAFARQFGFKPHRDFELSQYVLDEPDRVEPCTDIEFGRDGKPLFISGPDDDAPRILRQLESTAGQGNFHYLYRGDTPDPYAPDDPEQNAAEARVKPR